MQPSPGCLDTPIEGWAATRMAGTTSGGIVAPEEVGQEGLDVKVVRGKQPAPGAEFVTRRGRIELLGSDSRLELGGPVRENRPARGRSWNRQAMKSSI